MTRLQAGQPAPAFTLTDARQQQVSSADYAGRHLIVYFYPKAATPGCTTEACDFRDNLASLEAAGYAVVGISPDEPEALRTFIDDQALTFPLLSDTDQSVARAYGTYGTKTLGNRTVEGTLRSTFVIGPDGTLAHVAYEVDAQGHVAELRRTLGV
ncbi:MULTISPECIES: thioredoxin-dependent thiol peroxidase [Prauserella salsuginis group]|uniref:thioredoxin-dependent peroxiredoxin n=2 Tax=Prauserella salsuginis group TaxID=2893672 RepID=A0A839XVM7_9PSEU|nr:MULTISPECIES: thioredoxin-dependent thiol peroxidase [Prauserella salsuginis group]MBB3665434.1 peroxiredoxin Q/BCP [Prauserella sediminis]MCR3718717.1 peroxiredoxin Q/BCP [Prauserella flava]MCR3733287.1 peroxiredoxin Q/BCP [Prauserella salsuginis]